MKAEAERLRVIVDASEARSAEAEASAAAAGDAVEQHVNLCFLPLVFSHDMELLGQTNCSDASASFVCPFLSRISE